jgi:dienelactone hydrolase
MGDSYYPTMVHDYYLHRVRALMEKRRERLASVRTRADVMRLRAEVRAKLRRCFGPLPPRTPLNARVTGKVARKRYTIEKVLYESRPGFLVSANLYVPRGDGPFPVVLGPCGHSAVGKAEPKYQQFCSGLACRGYMTLIYDPLSQGERWQILRRYGSFQPGNCCHEHNQFGNRLAMLGEFFGMWRVWDGMRGLDYLLSRPEADRSHIGVTGNSGGGTLTTYLSALDDRFTMAAPSCFVTTFLCNLENELPADSEQTPPGILAAGLDMADYFIAQIPRPVLLLGQSNDYFDVRGLRQVYEELKRLYAICGAENDVELFVGAHDHGFYADNRHAMYRFFARYTGRPASARPSEGRVEKPETLYATPKGNVLKAGARPMTALLRERHEAVCAARKPLSPAKLKDAVRETLALPQRTGPPHYRRLPGRPPAGKAWPAHSAFTVETEPNAVAVVHFLARHHCAHLPARRRAVLYVPHTSSEGEAAKGQAPRVAELWAVDVRGIGLCMAETCATREFFHPYGSDYMYAVHGQMLNEPLLGRRVHDLLSVLDLLQAHGCREVELVGRGLGAITAAFAACLHRVVKRVTLLNAPTSYADMMEHPVTEWPRSAMAFGMLKRFDLPDVYALLRSEKKLAIKEPWDHMMRPSKRPKRTRSR